jgi:hypothetical protein
MMMKDALRRVARTLGVVGLLAVATSSARAEFIEYSTTVVIDQTPGSFTPGTATFPTGFETITQGAFVQIAPFAGIRTTNGNEVDMIALMSNPNPPHSSTILGGTDIVFAQIDASSTTNTTVTEAVAFNYTFTVTIKDYTSLLAPVGAVSGTATVQFTGRLVGVIGNGAVAFTNLNFATIPSDGLVMASNGHVFKVTPGGYTAPGTENNGSLGAHISLVSVPEPASMAMLGLGGIGAVGLFRRRTALTSA